MGVNLHASLEATPTASAIGSAMHGEGGGHSRWMEHNAPVLTEYTAEPMAITACKHLAAGAAGSSQSHLVASAVGTSSQRLRSMIIGPPARYNREDPLIIVVLSCSGRYRPISKPILHILFSDISHTLILILIHSSHPISMTWTP